MEKLTREEKYLVAFLIMGYLVSAYFEKPL